MKRVILVSIVALLFFAGSVYVGAWAYLTKGSRPLYGNFDVGLRCMGGHEIFYDLESTKAYEHCPGHRERKILGSVVRTASSATILSQRDGLPFARIDRNGDSYTLTIINRSTGLPNPNSFPAHQVTNPWRIWIPRILPE